MSVKIGVIISTTRPKRVGPKVANWFMGKVTGTPDATFELIDLAEENLPFLSEEESPASGQYALESTKAWSKKISGYDGFVFITAEYNNGYPAPLKNAIDSIYNEWDKKPVAFVSYGTYGGVRSVEQLVNVTAKIGMVPLAKNVVGIPHPWDAVAEDGTVDESFVQGNLQGLIETLIWWSKLLKKPHEG